MALVHCSSTRMVPVYHASDLCLFWEGLSALGLPPWDFCVQSFRIGVALDASDLGFSAEHIMAIGWWRFSSVCPDIQF